MNIRTAFEAAVAKYPERERRVALATFVGRYAMPAWPVTDYRCVGLDADVIKEFLEKCGLNDAFEDVTSSLDESAHMLKWKDETAAAGFAKTLTAQLNAPGMRAALYIAQIDSSRPTAPGLADEAGTGPDGKPANWDPLGLVETTEAIAKALRGNDGTNEGVWAQTWLSTKTACRAITAPLWVLERAMPGNLGLFFEADHERAPYSIGRYVTRTESLKPPFPIIAGYPVANVWGSKELHRYCPLDGYIQRTVGDLSMVPHDAADTPEDERRDVWMQVESAYVQFSDPAMTWDNMCTIVKPEVLWNYVASIYEHAYKRRVVLVPENCLVHVGHNDRGDITFVTSVDREVNHGQDFLEVRPSVLFLNEDPDPAKPSGASLVGAGEQRLVLFPGETTDATTHTREVRRIDSVDDAAAEWYAMTHSRGCALAKAPTGRPVPSEAGERVEALRAWAAGPHLAAESATPDNVYVGTDFADGYNGAAHIACSVVDDFVSYYDLRYTSPNAANWEGANAGMHMAPKPVVAVYSAVIDTSTSDKVNLLTADSPSQEYVTKALDALADPVAQLARRANPDYVQVVVETNIAHPHTGCIDDEYLKNMLLWAFQANRPKDANLTLLAMNCDVQVHIDMLRELTTMVGEYSWPRLWGSTMRQPGSEGQISSNKKPADVKARVLEDRHGRLVFVFGLKIGSPAEAVCRATFRWFAGLPLLSNEGMDAVAACAAGSFVMLSEDKAPCTLLKEVVRKHTESNTSGVVPGWTGMLSALVRTYGTVYNVPERSMYDWAAMMVGPTQMTAKSIAESLG